jgi:hypothetical protein
MDRTVEKKRVWSFIHMENSLENKEDHGVTSLFLKNNHLQFNIQLIVGETESIKQLSAL